jgi:hypothetical protein
MLRKTLEIENVLFTYDSNGKNIVVKRLNIIKNIQVLGASKFRSPFFASIRVLNYTTFI